MTIPLDHDDTAAAAAVKEETSLTQQPNRRRQRGGGQQDEDQQQAEEAFYHALEDVHTRFILNLPPEELATTDRIFFQLEQAWWYYEDIICDEIMQLQQQQSDGPSSSLADSTTTVTMLPRFPKMQPFCRKMFEISPLLSPLTDQFDNLWAEFSRYRRKISTYGTILLNKECTAVVLCQDYNSKSWTFPAGKVNQGETGIEAGARETYEETGFDPNCNFGLTKTIKDTSDGQMVSWNTPLREENAIRFTEGGGNGKLRTCYVCHGVPDDFPFAPVARKEVSDVQWHDLNNLPTKSFAVMPFIKGLKIWIQRHAKKKKKKNENDDDNNNNNEMMATSTSSTPGKEINKAKDSSSRPRSRKRDGSKKKDRAFGGYNSRHSTPGKSTISDADSDLIHSGLGEVGQENRWSEEDMFRVNEKLIGRKIEYDGNPQVFATKGFDGVDPHAFRVVGGGFMNSGKDELAPPPTKDKMQPLCLKSHEQRGEMKEEGYHDHDELSDDDDLKPFFSESGATPWGEVVTEACILDGSSIRLKQSPHRQQNAQGRKHPIRSNSSISSAESSTVDSSTYRIRRNSTASSSSDGNGPCGESVATNASGLAILTMLRGQNVLDAPAPRTIPAVDEPSNDGLDVFLTDREITMKSQKEKLHSLVSEPEPPREEDYFTQLVDWVNSLPESKPTKYFGDFRFDVDAIMQAMAK
mmetsp:Transcript_14917/g.28084  ORF Transcript_14917/g.28084 Transcript_14917/m.28084 type:complete len:694 (-) Transcript_14917:177-2258(-)